MVCVECQAPSTYRFCSSTCFVAYSKSRTGTECQVCQWMPLTQSVGNHNARGLCADCREDEAQEDWEDTSALEQSTDDVDTLVAFGGGAIRIEAVYGGKRKADTTLANEIVRLAEDEAAKVVRRRRRRSATGKVLRGWEETSRAPNEREIASMVGCSRAYVHKILRRLLG